MSNWGRMKKNARKQFVEGVEGSREYLEDLKRETAPQRARLGREARRQAPKVAAFALATISEMMRNYPRHPSQRRRRSPVKILLAAGLLSWLVVRLVTPRKR